MHMPCRRIAADVRPSPTLSLYYATVKGVRGNYVKWTFIISLDCSPTGVKWLYAPGLSRNVSMSQHDMIPTCSYTIYTLA